MFGIKGAVKDLMNGDFKDLIDAAIEREQLKAAITLAGVRLGLSDRVRNDLHSTISGERDMVAEEIKYWLEWLEHNHPLGPPEL